VNALMLAEWIYSLAIRAWIERDKATAWAFADLYYAILRARDGGDPRAPNFEQYRRKQ